MLRRRALWLCGALACAGCHEATRSDAPAVDPDRSSGGDRQRSGAQQMAINQPVTDEVSYPQGDATDWKTFTLDGNPGLLDVKLHWDSPTADLLIDVYDAVGQQIASSPGLQPGANEKHLVVEIREPGSYYVRVSAHGKDDASVYTLRAEWAGQATAKTVAAAAPDAAAPVATDAGAPATVEDPQADDDRGVQGRIISAYREGGAWVLHIDKGSAAGLKVGTRGAILEGPSGSEHLDGGGFAITEVVDGRRAIGKSAVKAVGRNSRVILYLGR